MKAFTTAAILSYIASASAGTTVWSGNFDYFNSASDFDNWSWANQVGPYQWYIHGNEPTTHYLDLSPSYKNPADTWESKGLKLTVDSTSHWNGQTMMRTELIPQSSADLGTGQMYYHFSIMHEATNPPGTSEHQIFFFESHFTELKVGVGSDPTKLSWCINGQPQWTTSFDDGVWYNFAYDIDFSAGTVGLWASTGSSPLVRVMSNQSASTATNSADFHVGVLRLGDSHVEDWYISCVFIESDSLDTSHCSSGSPPTSSTTPTISSTTSSSSSGTTPTTSSMTSSTSSTSTSSFTTSSVTSSTSSTSTSPSTTSSTTTSSASGPVQTKWGQCGGIGWSGPTNCVSGTTCTELNDWYHQCL